MHLQLDDVALFARIVELGTLSAAARERDVPVEPGDTRAGAAGAACGVRLLHRTTHGLSLTDEGDTFLAHCTAPARHRGRAAGRPQRQDRRPERLGAPQRQPGAGAGDRRAEPARPVPAHPQLHVDIAADDRMVDMAREGIDIAIRTGTPGSDTLVARHIGELRRALYAAPAYVARVRPAAATPTNWRSTG